MLLGGSVASRVVLPCEKGQDYLLLVAKENSKSETALNAGAVQGCTRFNIPYLWRYIGRLVVQ